MQNHLDYQKLPMTSTELPEVYEASIPSEFTDGTYDVMYFIEATDSLGNGRMFPDMEKETPYVIINLNRE